MEATGTLRSGPARQQATAVLAVRRYLRSQGQPGQLLLKRAASNADSVRYLAHVLGLSHERVRTALRVLDRRGDLAIIRGQGVLVLALGQPHPDDVPLVDLIRRRIDADDYRPDQALPLGVLALDPRTSAGDVLRACRCLIREGLLQSLPRGPHGPGVYVRRAPSTSGHRAEASVGRSERA
ncbi:hypothetical protein AB0N09_30740 [Streptomyces erythrochromogenes]|uniref:hypothetical protein n=1 Tax=Streptomyces erythrochromogenes TaxID=285574 RepID=UPI003427C93B